MDKKKAKLVYSEKLNQYYEVLRFDNDVGTFYIKLTSNKRDKGIHKDMILKMESEPDLNYVIMYDAFTTAESHFVKIMQSDCPYKAKLKELWDFKRNMLNQSDVAKTELRRNAEMRPIDSGTKEVQIAALKTLTSLDWKKKVLDNRASYNQKIPDDIMKLALSKRIFIERRDGTCRVGGKGHKRIPAHWQSKQQIQSNFPCGYLIKDKGGYIIAGRHYTMSDQDVIEFVKNHIPTEKKYHILYAVPMSLRKERQLAKCYKILKEYGLHYKNEHNYFFWVLDKDKNVVAGGKNGFGFKYLLKYCNKLNQKQKKSVTDRY